MSATPPVATGTTLGSLTGVRFIAALLVFGFHSGHYGTNGEFELFGAGMVGVSLFYLLSGFIMAWVQRSDDRPALFYRRRFARVYPAFFVAWLISLVLLTADGSVSIWDALVPPTMLQSWVPVEAVYFAGSAVFWSLSCEAFFYLLFPAIYKFVNGLPTRGVVLVAMSAGVVSIGFAASMIGVGESDVSRWFLIIFPPLRLMEFVIGVCLGVLFRRGWRLPVPPWVAGAIVAGGYVLATMAPYSLSRYAVTLVPFVILVCSLATADIDGRGTFLRWRPLVKLGVWSYCFYLLHAMVLGSMFTVADMAGVYGGASGTGTGTGTGTVVALALLALMASVVAAWILHVVIERPFERRLRPAPVVRADGD